MYLFDQVFGVFEDEVEFELRGRLRGLTLSKQAIQVLNRLEAQQNK
jgi:hypothetical protein